MDFTSCPATLAEASAELALDWRVLDLRATVTGRVRHGNTHRPETKQTFRRERARQIVKLGPSSGGTCSLEMRTLEQTCRTEAKCLKPLACRSLQCAL